MKLEYSDFDNWFNDKFEEDINDVPSNIYEYVSSKLKQDLENSDLWKELNHNMKSYNDEYFLEHNYILMKTSEIPVYVKTFDSLKNKVFRKNVLNNDNFPDPPKDEWITHINWYTKINDLLRTSITVKYLDGVKFLATKIESLANKHSASFLIDYEAREEGYYAAHINLGMKFKIVDHNWKSVELEIPVEIQITTQLQEVIKGLLHKMYKKRRITKTASEKENWQWNHKSLEFNSNYLGHILHYVEGMILEVRDKQKLK